MSERTEDNGATAGTSNSVSRLWGNRVRTGMATPTGDSSPQKHGRLDRPPSRVDTTVSNLAGLTASASEEESARIRAGDSGEETPGNQAVNIFRWIQSHPPRFPKHDGLAKVFLAGAAVLFGMQFLGFKSALERSRYAEASPISFELPWVPEKVLYYPGDTVIFRYIRTVQQTGDVVLQVDAFENTETGEGYSSAILARIVETPGSQEFTSVRRLPDYVRPGRYRLEGFAISQTRVRSQPAAYYSLPFTVGAKPK
jgi:hypothetical protein